MSGHTEDLEDMHFLEKYFSKTFPTLIHNYKAKKVKICFGICNQKNHFKAYKIINIQYGHRQKHKKHVDTKTDFPSSNLSILDFFFGVNYR